MTQLTAVAKFAFYLIIYNIVYFIAFLIIFIRFIRIITVLLYFTLLRLLNYNNYTGEAQLFTFLIRGFMFKHFMLFCRPHIARISLDISLTNALDDGSNKS